VATSVTHGRDPAVPPLPLELRVFTAHRCQFDSFAVFHLQSRHIFLRSHPTPLIFQLTEAANGVTLPPPHINRDTVG
jgi:hypothetical protein